MNLTDSDIPTTSKQGKPLKPPSARWHYAHPDGTTAFHICRWDKRDGKLIMPLTYVDNSWQWVGPPRPRPLLYAPALAARPQCPVLLTEGEKTADAARAYLTPEWEVTTWSGGSNAIKQTDFALLQGHRVVIWPDNDQAGIDAAVTISEILHGHGVAHAIVQLPDLPQKWDLADPLPDTLSADAVAVLIARTLQSLDAPVPAIPEYVNGHAQPGIDSDIEIICLGHRDRRFYFMSAKSQTIMSFSGKDLQDIKGLRELCPDDHYWYSSYGTNAENFNAGKCGAELMTRCYDAGIYSEGNIRGRGCWMDQGRVVFHAGDRLLVDGVPCDPIAIQSSYIYPKLPRVFDLTNVTPLTVADGRALQKIVHRVRWHNRDALTADIFAGFLATMMIAGALKFRSHGWVTGVSGAGKSYLVSTLAAKCVGNMAVIPVGTTTEAGIRSQLNSEAFPVLFDEAEGRGPEGEAKRQMIIQMMRISTQDSRGAVLKGSSGHKAHAFRVQSQFLLASIGVGLKEAADLNRCIVMSLDTPIATTREEQEARIAEFQVIDSAVKALPDHLPEQILARMLPLIPAIRDLADRLSTHFMRRLGTSTIKRVGDLLATPLAGLWFLTHDAGPTDDQIHQWLDRYNLTPWEGARTTAGGDEAIEILNHLTAQELTLALSYSGNERGPSSGRRSIGAILAHLARIDADDHLLHKECQRALNQVGIAYEPESRGVFLSCNSPALDHLLRGCQYPTGYIPILQRLRGSRRRDKSMWLGGKTARAVWLPLVALLGDKAAEEFRLVPPDTTATYQEEIPPGHPEYYEPGAEG